MKPNIEVGDVVLTAVVPSSSPVPLGRAVSFTRSGDANATGVPDQVMHRIVEVNQDGTFVTAGDANRDPDSTSLVREQITGQARLLVPWIGLPAL